MQKLNKQKYLLLIVLLGLQISCVKPPNVPVCENLTQHLFVDLVTQHLVLTPSPTCLDKIKEPECGHCTFIMDGTEIYVGESTLYNKKKWSEIKQESIYVPAIESYAPLKTYIINSCKKMKCDSQVDAFRIKIDSLNGINGAIKQ